MSDPLTSAIEKKLKGLLPSLTSDLKKQAKAAGWPKKIASSLSVTIDSGNLCIAYPQKLAKEVEDLEYGKVGGFANAVLRKFTAAAQPMVEDAVATAANDYITSSEVLF